MSTHALTKRVDAVLLVGMTPTPTEVLWLQGAGHPVVTLGVEVDAWPSVRIDDEQVSNQAVDHLVALGHRRIAFVGGLEPLDVFDFTTPELRQRGYRSAMTRHGLEVAEGWEQEGLFTTDGGVAAGERLLALPERPTAVFAASDEMAIGVIHALRAGGVDVPGEVSVIGVDDHEMARFLDLTTIRQPVQEQGRRAAARVLRLLDDPEGVAAQPPAREVVETEVVVRATTAAPAG